MMSLRAYARHRGCRPRSVQVAIENGRLRESVVLDARGRRWISDAALADREWDANTAHQLGALSGPGALGGRATLKEASIEERRWRGKLAELSYRRKAGALVEASEVDEAIRETFARSRDRLLRIPAEWGRRCPHLAPADVAAVAALVREALEELVVREAGGGG